MKVVSRVLGGHAQAVGDVPSPLQKRTLWTMVNWGDGDSCVGVRKSSRAAAAIGTDVVEARCHRCTGIMACDAPLSSSQMPRTNHPRGCGSNVRRPHLRNNADFATLLILPLTFSLPVLPFVHCNQFRLGQQPGASTSFAARQPLPPPTSCAWPRHKRHQNG